MALNRFMHPRNPYRNNKPDFKKLALEDTAFRKIAKQTIDGSVTIDFKDPECLRALCCAILKTDFGLNVNIPSDRLVPTVPQRLNYILWLEDLFASEVSNRLCGIDVGTGSCCIYPLLGAKKNGWKFLATELDEVNLNSAQRNVEKNNLKDLITVIKSDGSALLKQAVLQSGEQHIDFCMCNPPFFDCNESPNKNCRGQTEEGSSTSCDAEKLCEGGEVAFVKRMIDESLTIRTAIRVYTSMLGRKTSISKIKAYLREVGIAIYGSTEFCQGRTMRWAIAWTFEPDWVFPKSFFKQEKQKNRPPVTFIVPRELKCCEHTISSIVNFFREHLLTELQFSSATVHQDESQLVAIVTAWDNTWSNARKRRRQAMRDSSLKQAKYVSCTAEAKSENRSSVEGAVVNITTKVSESQTAQQHRGFASSSGFDERIANGDTTPQPITTGECSADHLDRCSGSSTSYHCTDTGSPSAEAIPGVKPAAASTSSCLPGSAAKDPLLKFSLIISEQGLDIALGFSMIQGTQQDLLHQIAQYFKNRLV